mmetsp:Transcript_23249/g.49496  ORF Transcript_23249/g.49496 Transcript_23249/m.49496 type:complete len:332 (-) Transcript_23249:2231-3226(-)
MRRQIHVHGVFVFTERVDNHCSKFQDFSCHITTSSTESAPVGEDHDGKTLLLEVVDSLSSLVRRIRVQNLSSLRKNCFARVGVGRVGGDDLLNLTSLNGDSTERNSSETSTSYNNTLTPSSQVFLETSLVKETQISSITSHHHTRIVRSRSRSPGHLSVGGVTAGAYGRKSSNLLWNETQPVEQRRNSLLVVINNFVRDSIGVHDLRSTKLVLRVVDTASKKFVQGRESSQDDRSLLHLNHTLSETDEVGTDTDTSSSDVTERKNFVVRSRSFTCNLSTSLKILNSDSVVRSNHIRNSPTFADFFGNDGSGGKRLVVLVTEVKVFKALSWA